MSESRLLNLLSLLQTPREWPGGELSERLGVSRRTIRRDIERLRDLGYPVNATMGPEGGYRLAAGTAMPPLLLDDEEAVAIAIGLATAARQAVTGVDEASLRALAKLQQVLPTRLRRRVDALHTAVDTAAHEPGADAGIGELTALAGAIAARERVRFAYRPHTGEPGARHAEPQRLVCVGRRWYLLAWDLDRADWRTFRVDRIDTVHPTGARADPHQVPGGDAATFVTTRLHTLAPVYGAVVTVHADAAEIVRRLGGTPAELRPLTASTCRVRLHPDTLDWLVPTLIRIGHDFRVHEPAELVTHVRALADRLARAC